MRIKTPFAAIVIFCAMFLLSAGSPARAAPMPPLMKADTHSKLLQDVRHNRRAVRLYVPIAPNYSAYDYPYYYARGYYPKHIGRGYVYYGRPYTYYRNPNARYARPYRHRSHARRGARVVRF